MSAEPMLHDAYRHAAPLGVAVRRLAAHPAWLAVAFVSAVVAMFGAVGADARWAAALGTAILNGWSVHAGVPFARAPTTDWTNVPVLAELVFHGVVTTLGDRGLLVTQVAAVALAFAALAGAMRAAGASEPASALTLLVVAAGAFPALLVARLQLFSLALFGILLLLLHRESLRPSRRIWLLPPLFALWSNLHGAVLAGVAVAAAYLLLERLPRHPIAAVGVLAGSAAALLMTPALLDTPHYYLGVARSEAARQALGLWSRLSPAAPLDAALVAAFLILTVAALRARPRAWELVAGVGLALLTVRASRSGVWLLMVAAVPAARGIRVEARVRLRTVGAATLVATVGIAYGIARGPIAVGAGQALLREAVARAGGTPILAEGELAEQVVLAGGAIWVGNPLDAFSRRDQRLYLAWTEGSPGGDAALRQGVRVVLVRPGSAPQRRLAATGTFVEAGREAHAVLYLVRGSR